LVKAAAEGQTRRVQKLLYDGADVDFRNVQGVTALHEAAYSGFEDTVQALLDAGADINASHDLCGTPLALAALKARANVVQILLDGRASADIQAGALGSALHAACAGDNPDIVTIVLHASRVFRVSERALVHISMVSYMSCTKSEYMITGLGGTNGTVSGSIIWTQPFRESETLKGENKWISLAPLQVSALYSCTNVVKTLLDAGADPKIRTQHEQVDLFMIAALNGHLEWLECLLMLDPQLSALIGMTWDWAGRNVLMKAAARGQRDSLECLLGYNARNLDAQCADGRVRGETAVIMACKAGEDGCLNVLVEYGADVNIPSAVLCMSPIMIAARHGYERCVAILLKANVSLEPRKRRTAYLGTMHSIV